MAQRARRLRDTHGSEKVQPNTKPVYCISKRVFDIVFSLAVLLVLWPLLVLVAVAIKIEDPKGRVFYVQTRVGVHRKPFRCYKFRSMIVEENAKERHVKINGVDGLVLKLRADPRVTRVGTLIRKTSIDELPQFFNVIKGDMSVVGPRPLVSAEAHRCDTYQRQRELVRPGITCYWQVSGRSLVAFDQRMRMDVQYVADQSFGLDMLLILRTIPAVLSARGAY